MSTFIYPDPEKPKPEVRGVMGDVFFLMLRSKQHQDRSIATLRWWWEPPLHLGQVWVFNFDDYPRAAVSWAMLSQDAQHRYVHEMKPLRPEDWRSGSIPWVIDWLSPYRNIKMESYIGRWIRDNGFPDHRFRYMRMGENGKPRRIVETYRGDKGRQKFRVMQPADLEAEGQARALDDSRTGN